MAVFHSSDFDHHEQVTYFCNEKSGLKLIVAIHNTHRGPALGGCRIWCYLNEEEAIRDALRLAKGMTYKAAMANLPVGGGKSVILGSPQGKKTRELLLSFGQAIDKLNGRYITGEDVGTTVADMQVVRESTEHVVGLPCNNNFQDADPAIYTAYGVYRGIYATLSHRYKATSLDGLTVAIQGLGSVGYQLCKLLHKDKVKLIVADLNPKAVERAVKEFNAQVTSPEMILQAPADILAPCALGGILNDKMIPALKAKIVAGSANNQLEHNHHGDLLKKHDILYAPDYVINAGGLIKVTYERPQFDKEAALQHISRIYETLIEVFDSASAQKIATNKAADKIAEARFKVKN